MNWQKLYPKNMELNNTSTGLASDPLHPQTKILYKKKTYFILLLPKMISYLH